ncbi:MAG: TRAFAC clade GTPase domain-containing protein, partial [Pirellulales bacterium]
MTVLESARFFEKEASFPCAICGSDNVGREGFCFHCLAPLTLSRSIFARGTPAQLLSVLGAAGAGKTVYLGLLLDVLSKGYHELQGLPNGSFSVAVQHQTISALERRRFPEKTPSEADHWQWVHCEITQAKKKRKRCTDLITPDLAGEAIGVEMDQPGTFETIRVTVRKSAALLVLIDSLRARDSGRDEDLFALKLISYLSSLHGGSNGKKKLPTPVGFVFTKCDLCPEAMDDPEGFAAANVPGLLRFCDHNLAAHRFFGAS